MPSLPRQPLNTIAPFQVQSPGLPESYQVITPELVVGEIVFSDGSTMTTSLEGGSLPEFLDGGTY